MKKVKNSHDLSNAQLFAMFRNETLTLLTDYITETNATLKGGKGLLAQYGGAITKRSVINAPNDRDWKTAIDNLLEKLGIVGELELDAHLYAIRYIADNGKKSVLSYHKDDTHLPELQRRNYLNVIPTICRSVEYFDASKNIIDTNELRPYFIDKKDNKQDALGIPKDKQIVFRNFKLESFKEIHWRGDIYNIID